MSSAKTFRGLRRIFPVVLLILAGLAVYGHTFSVPFQMDDMQVIFSNAVIHNAGNVVAIFQYDPSRFLTHYTFALSYLGHGLQVEGYHVVNLCLHLINALLCYYCVRLTISLAGSGPARRVGPDTIALLTALIFVVHPLQTQAVTYVVQRSVLLAVCFYLVSLILYIKLRQRFRWSLYAAIWFVNTLGAFCKPIFVTLPLMILLYEIYFFSTEPLRKKPWKVFLPYAWVVVLVPALLMLYFAQFYDLSEIDFGTRTTANISRQEYLFTQFKVVCKYIQLLFLPIGQNFDHSIAITKSLLEPITQLALFFLVVILGYAVSLYRRDRLLSFSILWFFVALSLESSIFPIGNFIQEHRCYLGMIGFGLFLCLALDRVLRPRLCTVGLALIIMNFAILAYARNLIWMDRVGFLQDVLKKSPSLGYVHRHLGLIYEEQRLYPLAEEKFQQAIIHEKEKGNLPFLAKAYVALGRIYLVRRQFAKAKAAYKELVRLEPQSEQGNINLAQLYYQDGDLKWAESQYRKIISFMPEFGFAYLRLGDIYGRQGRPKKAEHFYRQAVEQEPQNPFHHYTLGNHYFHQKRFDEAVQAYERAIAIDSNYFLAYNNLGLIWLRGKDYDKARAAFQKALAISPESLEIQKNLQYLDRQMGDSIGEN